MRIALVDDDVDFLAQTARTLDLILDERGVPSYVRQFASAVDLLTDLESGDPYDLYLLDVIMPGPDGIALGQRIRIRQPEAPILFFTTSRDFAVEAFALEATGYVLKPFTREAFAHALDRALRALPKAHAEALVVKDTNGIIRIPLGDIVLSETADHYQVVKTIGGKSHVVRMSLGDLFAKVKDDDRFIRIGRQRIVNLAHVTSFGGATMVFADGSSFTIPRRLLAEVKSAFMRFYVT